MEWGAGTVGLERCPPASSPWPELESCSSHTYNDRSGRNRCSLSTHLGQTPLNALCGLPRFHSPETGQGKLSDLPKVTWEVGELGLSPA